MAINTQHWNPDETDARTLLGSIRDCANETLQWSRLLQRKAVSGDLPENIKRHIDDLPIFFRAAIRVCGEIEEYIEDEDGD